MIKVNSKTWNKSTVSVVDDKFEKIDFGNPSHGYRQQ